jgi:tetratricopeptide (TPR) repeat protein
MFPSSGKVKIILALIVLIAALTAVFLPVTRAGFLKSWDDHQYIVDNALVQGFTPARLAKIATTFLLGNYHPLTLWSFALEFQLFRFNAGGYHWVNLALHIVNCLLVFWLVYLVAGNWGVALFAGLIFGIHPLRVESVAWISDQKDLLAAGFALLMLIGYWYYRKGRGAAYWIALAAFILSLLAKASALLAPIFLLLMDHTRGGKFDRRKVIETIPFFVVAAALGLIGIIARNSYQGQLGEQAFSIGQRALIGMDRFVYYFLGRNFIPGPYPFLNTYYLARNGLPVVPTIVAVLILAGIVFAAAYSLRITKKILWAFAFFGIFIFPGLTAVSLGYSADRFTYLPAVGIAYLGAEYFIWLSGTAYRNARTARIIIESLRIGVIAALAVMTRHQLPVWRDSLSLTDHWVTVYPQDPTVYLNRGLVLQDAKAADRALADFSRALAINPDYVEAYNRRALAYYANRDYDQAIADFTSALERDPGYAEVYYNRGNVYYDIGVFSDADADYTRAIRIDSTRAEAFFNRGNARARQGMVAAAVEDYTRAIKLKPDHARAYYNRLVSYVLLKDYRRAYEDVKKLAEFGVRVNPMLVDTLQKYAPGGGP